MGHIDDLTGWEDALGSGEVTVTFSLEYDFERIYGVSDTKLITIEVTCQSGVRITLRTP